VNKKSSGLVRELNLNTLRNTLKEIKIATKPRLAELTGLSVVTINSLARILLQNGEILEDEILQPELGRPAASYRFNEEYSLALIVYMHEKLGVDTAFFSIVNLYGEVVKKVEKKIENVNIDSFDSILTELLLEYQKIKIICFGMPGVEVDGKLLISDYHKLLGTSFTTIISDKFQIPVIFENDINAATVGYCSNHGITNEQCVIGIYIPVKYPLGAGIYLNGNIYKGRNGLAGEIKYLPLNVDWDNFDYNYTGLEEIIIKTVMSFLCMYNPDIIVIYGEKIDESIIEKIKQRCKTKIQEIMLSEIVISKEINKDFEMGILQLALQKLQS
jgi:hypothetical protein